MGKLIADSYTLVDYEDNEKEIINEDLEITVIERGIKWNGGRIYQGRSFDHLPEEDRVFEEQIRMMIRYASLIGLGEKIKNNCI